MTSFKTRFVEKTYKTINTSVLAEVHFGGNKPNRTHWLTEWLEIDEQIYFVPEHEKHADEIALEVINNGQNGSKQHSGGVSKNKCKQDSHPKKDTSGKPKVSSITVSPPNQLFKKK